MMDVRTFRAPNMQTALELVRRELGSNAVILHTREVRPSRWRRWFRSRDQRHVEVTAGTGMNVRTPPPLRPTGTTPNRTRRGDEMSPERLPRRPQPHEKESQIAQQLEALKTMVAELQESARRGREGDVPEELFHVYMQLIEADVEQDLARDLVMRLRTTGDPASLNDPKQVDERLARMIEGDLPVGGPISYEPGRQKVVALVGSTGVGKTTTIAKLAAHFRLRERAKLGLITVDTYRIAAVEQLRTYAEIIDLPMKVVMTPREMPRALAELDGLDLVLIDTAGRSPSDDLKIQELKSFLAAAGAHEVHLVVSAASSPRTLTETAKKFAAAGPTSLVLTKLDESAGLGGLLRTIQQIGLPLSYLTTGQNVPDDIEPAEGRRLARLILGQQHLSLSTTAAARGAVART